MHEITMAGTPFEMGLQHGRKFRDDLHPIMTKRQKVYAPRNVEDQFVLDVFERVSKAFPDIGKEIDGIASGAGIDLVSVARFAFADDLCNLSQCVAIGTIHGNPGPIFAKTIEAPTTLAKEFIVQTVKPDSGYDIIGAGKICNVRLSAGINSVGLGTGLVTRHCTDKQGEGIPILILIRTVLQYCATIQEAIDLLAEHKGLGTGYAILLIDDQGGIAVVEKSLQTQAVRCSETGYMQATVFGDPVMKAKILNPPTHSVNRFDVLEKLGAKLPQKPELKDLQDIIAYREGDWPINDPSIHMPVSVLGSCRERFLDVAGGRPDEAHFKRYFFD